MSLIRAILVFLPLFCLNTYAFNPYCGPFLAPDGGASTGGVNFPFEINFDSLSDNAREAVWKSIDVQLRDQPIQIKRSDGSSISFTVSSMDRSTSDRLFFFNPQDPDLVNIDYFQGRPLKIINGPQGTKILVLGELQIERKKAPSEEKRSAIEFVSLPGTAQINLGPIDFVYPIEGGLRHAFKASHWDNLQIKLQAQHFLASTFRGNNPRFSTKVRDWKDNVILPLSIRTVTRFEVIGPKHDPQVSVGFLDQDGRTTLIHGKITTLEFNEDDIDLEITSSSLEHRRILEIRSRKGLGANYFYLHDDSDRDD